MFNVIIRNLTNSITLPNVTTLNIGYRVVYVEFTEDGQSKIRAYGRTEFDSLEINQDGAVVAIYPLKGDVFKKMDFHFSPDTDNAEDINPEE